MNRPAARMAARRARPIAILIALAGGPAWRAAGDTALPIEDPAARAALPLYHVIPAARPGN